MKNIIITFLFSISISFSWAQVGINTTSPSATLDVNGSIKIDGKMYLENPGIKPISQGVNLLIKDATGTIREYDIDQSRYGPVNYIELNFKDVSSYGLFKYDTKISIDDYLVNITGFNFTGQGGSPFVLVQSLINTNNIEGQQVLAYKNFTTNTWFLRAYFPNSRFRVYKSSAGTYVFSLIDVLVGLTVYRTDFIANQLPDQNVDMGGSDFKRLAAPPGY